MEQLLPVAIPLVSAVLASLITAWFLRRSSKEANDNNAFKVVTDQLFALNKDLRDVELDLRGQLKEVRAQLKVQETELENTRDELERAHAENRSLAAYIKALLFWWGKSETPPLPEHELNWEQHL